MLFKEWIRGQQNEGRENFEEAFVVIYPKHCGPLNTESK